jgi:hypothetical protein
MQESDAIGPPRGGLLRLAAADNVAVATVAFAEGQVAWMDDTPLTLVDPIPMGHKVAVAAIAAGEKIVKYGCPIGSATRPIRPGQHVHLHNLQSDYFPLPSSPASAGQSKEAGT